jgi:hypothetical protein
MRDSSIEKNKISAKFSSSQKQKKSHEKPLKAFLFYSLLSAEFFASTRRLPAAARSRTEVHRVRAVRQKQHSNCGKPPLKIPDGACPHNTKRACTILLLAKKIKNFYSFSCKHLAISVNRKIENFRTKRASLCKGWGDNVFFVKV